MLDEWLAEIATRVISSMDLADLTNLPTEDRNFLVSSLMSYRNVSSQGQLEKMFGLEKADVLVASPSQSGTWVLHGLYRETVDDL